jgi:hypothetical protein
VNPCRTFDDEFDECCSRLILAGKKRRGTEALNHILWGKEQEGKRNGFLHQVGNVIEEVFRPTAKRQELLLKKIIDKLEHDDRNTDMSRQTSTSRRTRARRQRKLDRFQVNKLIVMSLVMFQPLFNTTMIHRISVILQQRRPF